MGTDIDSIFDSSTILGIPQDNPQVTPKDECRYDVCVVMNKDFYVAKPAQIGKFTGGKYHILYA